MRAGRIRPRLAAGRSVGARRRRSVRVGIRLALPHRPGMVARPERTGPEVDMAIPRVRRPYLIAVLAVGLVLALLVGGRAAWRLAHRFDRPPPVPRQTDATQIAGWMS